MPRPLQRAALTALLCMALAAGHLALMWSTTQRGRGIDWDEFGWLAASDVTFRLMFVDPSVGSERWHEGFQATTYGAMNPNVAKLVMGAALHWWGYDLEPPPFFPLLGPPNVRYDRLPPKQRGILARAHVPYVLKLRWLGLWTSAACAVALFFVGRAIGGSVLGAAAYVAFALTPLVEKLAFAVYTDMLLLLMTLLSTLVTVQALRWWARPESRHVGWRTAAAFVPLAALFGGTVGTKYNGALVCIAGAASALVLWLNGRFRHHRAWHTALSLAGTGAVAFGVFVALNPQLHGDVFGRIAWSVRAWSELIGSLQADYHGHAITTLRGQVAAVYRNGVLQTGPFARVLPAGSLVLTALGLASLGVRWTAALRGRGDVVGLSVLAMWVLVMVAGTTLWLPLDWSRYYLPLVPALCLLQAVAIDAAWRWRSTRTRRAPAAGESERPPSEVAQGTQVLELLGRDAF